MNRRIPILAIAIAAIASNCYAQDLLAVDWQKVVCTDGYIDGVFSICNDNSGNTYTLGSFENAANCLGDDVDESAGHYFLTKQNSNGDKVFTTNLGGTDSFTFGDIQICNNGDLVLGLCFKSTFFLNGDSIANSVSWSSVILKLDKDLNLKWFKAFPANSNTYVNRLLLDKDENVYASIIFLDSIAINGNIYSQKLGYATIIAKLSSGGVVLWAHHYYSDYILINKVLKLQSSCNSCPSTLFIAGEIHGDSILTDGVLKAQRTSTYNNQTFVATMNEYGDLLQTNLLDDGIRSITDICFHQNRIFFAGAFTDTVSWNNTYATPIGHTSIYIGELCTEADIIGFADQRSNDKSYLTGFKISPQYGFVLSGVFIGSFTLQSASIVLDSQYDRGSFIASINDTLGLNDCKYIKGGSYNLRHLAINSDWISGAAIFERTCDFKNQSCFAWNDDISTFQTTDINQLSSFTPHSFPSAAPPIPFFVQIYPNPFRSTFRMNFSGPIYSTSLVMKNAIGQICKDITISRINDTEVIIDATGLATGLYIIQYRTCNNFNATCKLLKSR